MQQIYRWWIEESHRQDGLTKSGRDIEFRQTFMCEATIKISTSGNQEFVEPRDSDLPTMGMSYQRQICTRICSIRQRNIGTMRKYKSRFVVIKLFE